MKTIAIYNLKGGVGKTVTAANIGHLYATHRTHRMKGTPRNSCRRTLLIDCDPQGNLSLYFKRYDPEGPCWLSDQKIYGTDWPFLDIAPGNMDLFVNADYMIKKMRKRLDEKMMRIMICVLLIVHQH